MVDRQRVVLPRCHCVFVRIAISLPFSRSDNGEPRPSRVKPKGGMKNFAVQHCALQQSLF